MQPAAVLYQNKEHFQPINENTYLRPQARWYQLRAHPWYARSASVHNAIIRSLSHGEVPCHRPWTFPSISQESLKTQSGKVELPNILYPTILSTVKCAMIRPQRYTTLQKPISGYQPQVGSGREALINIADRTLGNDPKKSWSVSIRPTIHRVY